MGGYDIKPTKWLSFDFNELWHFRELFLYMAWRDIKVKYKQTFLGFAWVILQPLALMAIFSTLWLRVMKPVDMNIPYPLFAYSGLIFWQLFSSGISSAGESMISNSNIIKKVYFPRIIIPASALITALFDFVMTLIILIMLLIFYHSELRLFKFAGLFTLSVFLTTAASFAIGLIVSSATVRYRDFRYVVPFFLQAFFFVSPVVYPLALLSPGILRSIISLNPLAGSITIARASLTGQPVDLQLIASSILITGLLLLIGLIMFRKNESQFSDLL